MRSRAQQMRREDPLLREAAIGHATSRRVARKWVLVGVALYCAVMWIGIAKVVDAGVTLARNATDTNYAQRVDNIKAD